MGQKARCGLCDHKKKAKKMYQCDRCDAYICKKCIKHNVDQVWECKECETLYDLKQLVHILKPQEFLKLWMYIEGYSFAVNCTANKRDACDECGKLWKRVHTCEF